MMYISPRCLTHMGYWNIQIVHYLIVSQFFKGLGEETYQDKWVEV